MKTLRFSMILVILQFCTMYELRGKECIVAGLSKDKSSPIILRSYYASDTTMSSPSGAFRFRISINTPRYFQLGTDKTIHLFLIPGDSIFINCDNKAHATPANESALISNYLIDWYAITDSQQTTFDRVAFYSKDAASFQRAVADLYALLRAPLNNLLAGSPGLNKEFVRLEKARINFWVWCPLNRYEYRYQEYTRTTARLPGNYYDYLRKANFNDPAFLQLSDFNDFTSTFLDMKVFKASRQNPKLYEDPYGTTKTLLKAIGETFTNQRVLDEILYHHMWAPIYYLDVNDSLFAIVAKTIKNPKYVKGLRTLYRSLQKFQAGKTAPDFRVTDAKGGAYTLKDFRGKYLLIDVWGIYCGPCIKELPTLKEIEAEFHGTNITFIAVNLDGTKDAWIKRVRELNLDGLQCMATNGWDSDFRKAYGIEQVPTFVLIDREGKFVDARAKLPTEGLRYALQNLPAIGNKEDSRE